MAARDWGATRKRPRAFVAATYELEHLEGRTLLSTALQPGPYSNAVSVAGVTVAALITPTAGIPAPTGLRVAEVTTSSVTLAWNPSTYNESDPENSYHVYEAGPDGGTTLVAAPGNVAGATVSGLLPGSTHSFVVTLLDSDAHESAPSAPLTITTYAPPTITHPNPDRVDPRAAVGVPFTYELDATGVPPPTFALLSGPAGAAVDASGGTVTWTPAAGQEGPAAIAVRAANPFGQADWAFTVPVLPAGADLVAPSVVTGVVPSNPKPNGTELSWDAASDNTAVNHYRIRVYSSDVTPALLTRQDTTTDVTSFTLIDPALTFNSTYRVKVTAVDAAGNESDLAATPAVPFPTASVDVTPPTAPTDLVAGDLTTTSVTLTWSPSTDETGVAGYRVYRRYTTRTRSSIMVHYALLVNNISPAATSAGVSGLTPGAGYSLLVEAFDAAGNRARSGLVAIRMPLVPSFSAAAPPTIVAGQQVLNFYVGVAGNPTPATTLTSGPEGMTISTPYAGSILVHWEPAPSVPAGDYPFTLQAANDFGTTQQSYVVHVLPFETDITRPGTVSLYQVDGTTATTADLSWSPATDNVGVDHYTVNLFAQIGYLKQFNRTWLIPAGTGERVVANLTGLVAGKKYAVTITSYDAAGNAGFPLTASVTTDPANVIDAYVSGSAWAAAFKSFLAAQPGQNAASARGGFRVTDLGAASTPLPFVNLDVIGLRLNGSISAAAISAGLTVTSDGVALPVTSVTFDTIDTRLVLVRLARPLPTGMLRVQVAGVEMPSGLDVDFSVPVRRGDVNGDGKAGILDLVMVRNALGRSTLNPGVGTGAYSVAADVNGSGAINVIDLATVRSLILNTAVAAPPAPSLAWPAPAPAKGITDTVL